RHLVRGGHAAPAHPRMQAGPPGEGRRLGAEGHRGREGGGRVGRARAFDSLPARPLDHAPAREDPRMNDLSNPSRLVEGLRAIVGDRGLVAEGEKAPYENDWRDAYHGRAAAVVRPASTEEVAKVVELLAAARVPIVP